jgi:mannosyltransferase
VRTRRPTRAGLALLLIVAAGAAIRFSTLDLQSFWVDEGITVHLLRMDFGGMFSSVLDGEQTPPVYYVLAWLWTRPFGTGEAGLRSLSALAGTVTIPVAWAIGRRLVSERVGLVAAALIAFNPLLVWYSQEARSYALLVLLAGLSILTFVRALERSSARSLALWAVSSALALCTHYFALFVVVPEAVWLLLRAAHRRRTGIAVAAVAAIGAVLLPLAIHQTENPGANFIGASGLGERVLQLLKQYLVGYASPVAALFTVLAAIVAVAALWLALGRTGEDERRAAGRAAVLLACAAGIPIVLAVTGADYLITRNVIAGIVPFVLLLAIGLGARRAGPAGLAGAGVLCGLGLGAVLAVDARPEFQRDNWRGVARILGPATDLRGVVVTPAKGQTPLGIYARGLSDFPSRPHLLPEIDLIAVAVHRPGQTPRPPRPTAPRHPPDFTVVYRRYAPTYTLIRMRAPQSVPINAAILDSLRLAPGIAATLMQSPAR